MDRHLGARADLDRLPDRVQDGVTLVAHVREVRAPVLARDARQLDQLLGVGVDRGRVDEGGGHSDRPVLHALTHERPHLLELLGRRLDVLVAEHDPPHLGEPDVVRHVQGDAQALQVPEVLRVRAPADLLPVDHRSGRLRLVALRRRRAALTGEIRRDALPELALGARRVGHEHEAGLAHHIDEARRDDPVPRVDHASRGPAAEVPNLGDPVAPDPDVGAKPGVSGAVDDARVRDEHVERPVAGGRGRARGGQHRQGPCDHGGAGPRRPRPGAHAHRLTPATCSSSSRSGSGTGC